MKSGLQVFDFATEVDPPAGMALPVIRTEVAAIHPWAPDLHALHRRQRGLATRTLFMLHQRLEKVYGFSCPLLPVLPTRGTCRD
jgi:hypothetical protein